MDPPAELPSLSLLERRLSEVLRGFETHSKVMSELSHANKSLAPIYAHLTSDPKIERILLRQFGTLGPTLCHPNESSRLTWLDVLKERLTQKDFQHQDNGLYHCSCKDISIELTGSQVEDIVSGVLEGLLYPRPQSEEEREEHTFFRLKEYLTNQIQQARKGKLSSDSARTCLDDIEQTAPPSLRQRADQLDTASNSEAGFIPSSHGQHRVESLTSLGTECNLRSLEEDTSAVTRKRNHRHGQSAQHRGLQVEMSRDTIEIEGRTPYREPPDAQRPQKRSKQLHNEKQVDGESCMSDTEYNPSSLGTQPKEATQYVTSAQVPYTKEENAEGREFVLRLADNGATEWGIEQAYRTKFGICRPLNAITRKFLMKGLTEQAKNNAKASSSGP
ncbi:unnamed protein product [Penicillium bialowiezense]